VASSVLRWSVLRSTLATLSQFSRVMVVVRGG
jgi:hypothetical protein